MVGQPGDIKQWIKIVKTTPGSMVTNPAMLAGAGGYGADCDAADMAEITDYLATIDEKLDTSSARRIRCWHVLDGVDTRGQGGGVWRGGGSGLGGHLVEGAELGSDDSRDRRGTRCVAGRSRGQDRREEQDRDLAETAKEAEAEVQKWLVVLARRFELHDAVGVLGLDRGLDVSPDET